MTVINWFEVPFSESDLSDRKGGNLTETFCFIIAALHPVLYSLGLVSMLRIEKAGDIAWIQTDLPLDIQSFGYIMEESLPFKDSQSVLIFKFLGKYSTVIMTR